MKPLAPIALAVLTLPATAQVWTPVSLPGTPDGVVTDVTDSEHLVVSNFNLQAWHESFDGGTNWVPLQAPPLGPGAVLTTYSIDSQGHLIAWLSRTSAATPAAGPIAMIRIGATWQPLGPDFTAGMGSSVEAGTVLRGTLDPDLLTLEAVVPDSFGGNWSLYHSTDDGANWSGPVQGAGVFSIVEGSTGPYLLSRFTSFVPDPFTSVHRSTGLNTPDQWLRSGGHVDFGFSAQHPDAMWAITAPTAVPGDDQQFVRSWDGGASWTTLHALTGSQRASSLTVHPSRPECAVLLRATQTMEITLNGGASFDSLGVPYRPLAFVENGRVLYASQQGSAGLELYRTELFPSIGASECSAQINSSGRPASIAAFGSNSVAENGLALLAIDCVPDRFGYFIGSLNPGFVQGPGGSFGDLCLSGQIGRFTGLLQDAGPYGTLHGALDLTAMPTPTGYVAAQAGQTWRFQAWFRDSMAGVAGSNFSDAIAVTLVP